MRPSKSQVTCLQGRAHDLPLQGWAVHGDFLPKCRVERDKEEPYSEDTWQTHLRQVTKADLTGSAMVTACPW